ncbi:hypothetical protein TSUD_420990, partial [Trifolium subterraneum]
MLDIPQEGNLRTVEMRGTEDPSREESWTFLSHEDWKNPPSLNKYDGTTDPDEHIQSTVANLKAIIQGPEEPLRSYIERFNKVSIEVDATDKMKLYLLEEGLREGTKLQEAVGIVKIESLDAFFELAQRYIKWEKKHKASEVMRPRNFKVGGPSSQREERRGDEKKREGGKVREAKPPKSQFTYHTPLNAPWDTILSEISNAEFKSADIRFLKQLPAKPNVDKKKSCRFHKSYGHVTEDCVHLKDAIEIL